MTGHDMHTLSMIALLASASTVAIYDIRELFVAWYSDVAPPVSTSNFALAFTQVTLCIAVVLIVSVRLAFFR